MKAALLLVAGVILGSAAGGYGGWRTGNASVLNHCLYADAKQVQTSVAALKLLRAGERALAVEALEAGMDDTLVPFDPAQPYRGLEEPTIAEINRAILEARSYRAANPRKSSRPHVDAMVGSLLSRGAYRR
ncbi:MAG: hypothetical protein ACREU1_10750 [Burkholderiales bacterium]